MGSCRVRPPAVAGEFYPAEPRALAAQVDACIAKGRVRDLALRPKAIIAPHAGYAYSGEVAGCAYAQLRRMREEIERVVLIGPSHRVLLRGMATPAVGVTAFSTPLGEVALDTASIERLLDRPWVAAADEPHAWEHSLEVQLPFLQRVLDAFCLVPLVAGDASAREVADVLDLVWGGPETLVVVSSDLSHYLDYDTARGRDARTSEAIARLDPEALDEDSACGRVPVRGLLVAARRHGLRAHVIDVRSSGDTAGGRDRVVGYGAYAFA